jgi:hypothetical protein
MVLSIEHQEHESIGTFHAQGGGVDSAGCDLQAPELEYHVKACNRSCDYDDGNHRPRHAHVNVLEKHVKGQDEEYKKYLAEQIGNDPEANQVGV